MTERRRYCPKAHDTFVVGRDSSYRCLQCKRDSGRAAREARRIAMGIPSRAEMMAEREERRRLQQEEWAAARDAKREADNERLRRWTQERRRQIEKLRRAASKPKAKEPKPPPPPSNPQPRRRPQASPGHVWRSCIVCHGHFEVERYARKAPSRCREHRSGWDAKPKERDLAYADPTYRRLRAEILAPKPLCSYPGCRLVADTLDHIVPVSRGGQNTRENLRPMCRRHNEALGRAAGNETKRRRKS